MALNDKWKLSRLLINELFRINVTGMYSAKPANYTVYLARLRFGSLVMLAERSAGLLSEPI